MATIPDMGVMGNVFNISETTATALGEIVNTGGENCSVRGFCYGLTENPTIADQEVHTTGSFGAAGYTMNLTGITGNHTYYIRAYAINSAGPGYSTQMSFSNILPVVTTTDASNIEAETATCGGEVTGHGGSYVYPSGVCWNITGSPVITDSHTVDESGNDWGLGVFTSHLTGLTKDTLYYFRAYGRNAIGTAYGAEKTFITKDGIPTFSTSEVTVIETDSATVLGSITDDGGYAITERGVCYSVSENPTTSDDYTSNGAGEGSFISRFSGLVSGTLYYIKPYAINNYGTAYGNQVSFITVTKEIIQQVATYVTALF